MRFSARTAMATSVCRCRSVREGIANLAGWEACSITRQSCAGAHAATWAQIPSAPSHRCGGAGAIISGILEHGEAEVHEFAHGGAGRRHLALATVRRL